jgi:hypothetical protein
MVGPYQHSSGFRACVIGCPVDESKVARPFAKNDLLQPRAPNVQSRLVRNRRSAAQGFGWMGARVRGADSKS